MKIATIPYRAVTLSALRPLASLPFRLATVSFLLNFAMQTSYVFLPLYAKSVGASTREVGFIAAVYGLTFLISSILVGRQTDRYGRVRFIRFGLGLLVVAYLSQMLARSTTTLMVARGAVGFCLGIASAAIVAYAFDHQKQVGKVISYGSLGWLFGAGLATFITDYEALFLTSAITTVIACLFTLKFKEAPAISRLSVGLFPLHLLKADWKIYLPLFLRQVGAQAVWAIMPLYLVNIGASKLWIAIFEIINCGVQFITMRFVEKFDPARAFRFGLLTSALVFVFYGLANHYMQIIPVQVLLAISWSCLFIGSLSYLLRKNVERGTVSAQVYSTLYLSASLGPFMGGAISQAWGFSSLMYFSAATAFLGFLTSHGLVAAGKTSHIQAVR